MKVRLAIAPWRTMEVPTQQDKDRLLERICDARTKASRERSMLKYRRPWNTTRIN
jgi:hypothetical protein